MKTFKILDVMIQLGAIAGCLVYYLLSGDKDTFFVAYFLVGAWQVISMVVHSWTGNVYKRTIRSYYHWITLVTILLIPTLIIFYLLLFAAPVMAVFYFSLCVIETKRFLSRPQRIFA